MVLQSIRDRLTGIIAIFIFGILIIPFAFVGVSSYFTSDAVNAVAVVNDQEITISEYNTAFQNYRRRMQAQLGARFDPVMFDQPIIKRQFLDQMIDEELMAQVSIESGLAVDNETLARAIREVEGFHVDGEFSAEVYQARLSAQGMTPKQFEMEMRSSMVLNQFPTSIANSAITTNWERNDFVALMEQQRAFQAVIVPAFPADVVAEEATNEAEATEDEAAEAAAEEAVVEAIVEEAAEELAIDEESLLAWYEVHKGDFMSTEMVAVDYLELDASTMEGSVEPEEDMLKDRFEEQQARFITPESRQASHILIEVDSSAPEAEIETARQLAEELATRARDGEAFAEMATANSQDVGSASEGGDLGWIEPGFMVQAFEDGLYALPAIGAISDPIRTGFGWHVIYLRDIRPAEGMTYTEARDILLEEYVTEANERRFLEAADRLVDIIYEDPTTLDAAADELNLEVLAAGPFGRQGSIEGVAANMEFVNTSFSDIVLGQGVVSDPVDLGENHIALILMREHLPEAQLPLEDVREQVVAGVRLERAMEAASLRANELLASLTAGTDLATLAEAPGLELIAQEAATRRMPMTNARLRDEIFLMPAPGEDGPATVVVEVDGGYAVVQLDSVTDGTISEEDALRAQSYERRITNATANTEVLGFIRMLRAQSIIEVNEDRL